jgi:hypothetical protein
LYCFKATLTNAYPEFVGFYDEYTKEFQQEFEYINILAYQPTQDEKLKPDNECVSLGVWTIPKDQKHLTIFRVG